MPIQQRPNVIVGREAEQRQLRELLDQAIAGHGSLALVSGEAGIGKTTLVNDLIEQTVDRGALVLTSHCYDLTTTPPYGPWLEITRRYPTKADDLPDLPGELRDGEDLRTVSTQGALFRLVASFFAEIAATSPLLIVLEDLHWSDLESPQLLRYLARELVDQPILFVASYRDDELTRRDPLFQLIPTLVRECNAARVELRAWTADNITDLVQERFQLTEGDQNRLVAHLADRSEGNPLFVHEILDAYHAEEVLTCTNGVWQLTDLDQVFVPTLIIQLIEGRLTQLDGKTRDLLELAAVIGQDVPVDLLIKLSDLEDDEIALALSQALDAHLLEEAAEPGVVRFHHALAREAIYSGILLLRRQALHRRIADIMQEGTDPDPDRLVAHLERSNDPRLIEWLICAGDSAMSQFAWDSAVDRYQRTVALLEIQGAAGPEHLCTVLLKLGNAQNNAGTGRGQATGAVSGQIVGAGHVHEAQSTFWKAVEIARREGLPTCLGEAALGIAGINIFTNHGEPAGVRLTAEALELLPESDSILRARLLARLATGVSILENTEKLTDYASVGQVDGWSKEAIDIARRLEDRDTIAYTLHCRNAMLTRLDNSDIRQRNSAEVASLATQSGNLPLLADELYSRIFDLSTAGDLNSARKTFDHFARITVQIAMPVFDWRTAVHQAGLYLSEGRYEDFGRQIELCDAAWPRSGASRAQKLNVARENTDIQTMDEIVHESRLDVPPFRDTLDLQYLIESGQEDAAHKLFESRIDDGRIFGELAQQAGPSAYYIAILSEACAALNDAERASILYDYWSSHPAQNVFARFALFSMGSTAHYLGLLAATMAAWDNADGHFSHALEQNEGWGFRPAAAYTRFEWARSLIARDTSGDANKARTLLSEARSTADELGMIRLQRLIASQEGKLSPAADAHPAGLTPREIDVLALVAQGLTDAQIAEALFISPSTVMNHVSNILGKLQVSSRTAAAALAVREGIV